jgi:hypothetical protein
VDWLLIERKITGYFKNEYIKEIVTEAIQLTPNFDMVIDDYFTYYDCKRVLSELESREGSQAKNIFGSYIIPYLEKWNDILNTWQKDYKFLGNSCRTFASIALNVLPTNRKMLITVQKQLMDSSRKY